jgi:hypothetical protein
LLAMDVNDDAGRLDEPVAWTFFASRLAPTGPRYDLSGRINLIQHPVRGDLRPHDAVGNTQQRMAIDTVQMHVRRHHWVRESGLKAP